jgi:hypothetical protein
LQAGGQRFDPVQLHQIFSFAASRLPPSVAWVTPIWKQAGQADRKIDFVGQVSTASGLAFFRHRDKVWMFDNEIDWVTHLET